MPGPLAGYRIVDLTTMISGPVCTMLLGDQGADVIKVEMPRSGDHVRRAGYGDGRLTASFLNNNRNKRSITLDLKTEEGLGILKRLARTADVMVQNFRPGVVERMGVGEDEIRKIRPDIIYVSISGFGEKGPYAGKPVYDPIVQALSGLTTIQAGSDEARPRLVRTIVPDKLTGITAAQAVTAALLHRERTGEGQHIRLSMLDAVVSFLWHSDMGGQTFIGKEVSAQRAATFIDLIYETKDGHMSVSVMSNPQWAALAHEIGRPELIEDPRFATPADRDRNADERLKITQAALKTDTTAAWLDRLEAAGVPCAPVLTRSEMIRHPQILANETVIEVDHPHAGRLRQTRPAARFDKTPAGIRRGAPLLGEHTDEILAEIGCSAGEIEAFKRVHEAAE